MVIQEGVGPPPRSPLWAAADQALPDAAVRCGPALASASRRQLFSRRLCAEMCPPPRHLRLRDGHARQRLRLPPELFPHLLHVQQDPDHGRPLWHEGQPAYRRTHFETLLQGEYPPGLSYTELAAKRAAVLPYISTAPWVPVQKGAAPERKSPALGGHRQLQLRCPPYPGRPRRPSPGSARRIDLASPHSPLVARGRFP